jgi:hypothetical protein
MKDLQIKNLINVTGAILLRACFGKGIIRKCINLFEMRIFLFKNKNFYCSIFVSLLLLGAKKAPY